MDMRGRPGLTLGRERVICFCPRHQQGQRPATELEALCRESGCQKKDHFSLQPVLGGGSSETPQCRGAGAGLCCRPALAPSHSLPW